MSLKKINLNDGCLKFQLKENNDLMFYGRALFLMENEPVFLTFFVDTLKRISFPGYVWEMIPVAGDTIQSTLFEFTITESRHLTETIRDKNTFKEHFQASANLNVVGFFNINGDAYLISPMPTTGMVLDYSHLGNFMSYAPVQQINTFWQEVARYMTETVLNDPKSPYWLSTAGLAVSWFHVRIDNKPKYYRYNPYLTYRHEKSEKHRFIEGKFLYECTCINTCRL